MKSQVTMGRTQSKSLKPEIIPDSSGYGRKQKELAGTPYREYLAHIQFETTANYLHRWRWGHVWNHQKRRY